MADASYRNSRRGTDPGPPSLHRGLIVADDHDLASNLAGTAATGAEADHTDMGSTLRQYLHIPFRTETGRWLLMQFPGPDGASTRDMSDVVQRLGSHLLHTSGRSFDVGRVLAGALMAIPTGGIALGVGSAMMLDGSWGGGLFNLLFFGAIAAYGVWLVVSGVRSRRAKPRAPTAEAASMTSIRARTDGPVLLNPEAPDETRQHDESLHPRIRAFLEQGVRTHEPCAYDYRGMHLWGVTRGRSCKGLPFMLSLVAASLGVGFWIPAFTRVALGLVILILLAAALTRLSEKPTRQFHLDLTTTPPVWSSNDERFWQPVKAFFALRQEPERPGWLKRRRGGKSAKGSL
jgi:hypothetical protein